MTWSVTESPHTYAVWLRGEGVEWGVVLGFVESGVVVGQPYLFARRRVEVVPYADVRLTYLDPTRGGRLVNGSRTRLADKRLREREAFLSSGAED